MPGSRFPGSFDFRVFDLESEDIAVICDSQMLPLKYPYGRVGSEGLVGLSCQTLDLKTICTFYLFIWLSFQEKKKMALVEKSSPTTIFKITRSSFTTTILSLWWIKDDHKLFDTSPVERQGLCPLTHRHVLWLL